MLKPLRIATKKIGPGKTRINGYIRADFEDVFRRYLGSDGVSQPDNRTECDEIRTSEILQPDSPEQASPVVKCEKPNNGGLPSGSPVAKGDTSEESDHDNLDRVLATWKDAFGIGMTRHLDHIVEMANERINPSLNAAFLAVAAQDDGQGISNVLLSRWLRDHRGDAIGGLCLSYGGVDEAGRPLWTLEYSEAAFIPFMLTQEIKHRLRVCGYSDADIANLTPQQAHMILAQAGWSITQ